MCGISHTYCPATEQSLDCQPYIVAWLIALDMYRLLLLCSLGRVVPRYRS